MHSFSSGQTPTSGASKHEYWTRTMFRNFTSRLSTFRSYRNNIRQLQMMDDRELADIGVSRAEITTAVRHGRIAYI